MTRRPLRAPPVPLSPAGEALLRRATLAAVLLMFAALGFVATGAAFGGFGQ